MTLVTHSLQTCSEFKINKNSTKTETHWVSHLASWMTFYCLQMRCLWRIWAVSAMVAVAVVEGVRSEEPWVWTQNRKASSIPGYVEPTTTTSSTTTAPPITTFRPAFRSAERGRSTFRGASANPYFLMMVGAPHRAEDGTTKSRVVVDTAFEEDGPEPLVLGDTYTTVDRLQSSRGTPPRLPRPQRHQLGGLHPDEVFYANDDLLITRGGGFHSEVFEEPSQLLHEDDDDTKDEDVPTKVASAVSLPPSPHQEYNGNIPIIVPPPTQTRNSPFSYLVGGDSRNHYMVVPYVYPRYTKVIRHPPTPVRYMYYPGPARLQTIQPFVLPHSLVGDTDVNYLHPRPPINPDAEVFVQPNYSSRRRPRLWAALPHPETLLTCALNTDTLHDTPHSRLIHIFLISILYKG